ncbi:MAG: CvpA family protein [Oscillospiraceae bacterium]|nr:CvpA family protein [Oscillospiraceae bacterium]
MLARLILDIMILAILALCTWDGFKRGFIGAIAGILVVVIALLGGSLLSHTYAGEVIPALEPFVDGYIDSQASREKILETLKASELLSSSSDRSLDDVLSDDPSLRADYAYLCMTMMGFNSDRSVEMATEAVQMANANPDKDMTEAVVDVLCSTISYIVGLLLAFLMILIAVTALGNFANLSFRLPNMQNLDEIGGAVLGFVRGFLYCILLCWMLSYLGILLGKTTIDRSVLCRFFQSFDFVTSGLH